MRTKAASRLIVASALAILIVIVSLSPLIGSSMAKDSQPHILLVFTGDIMPARNVQEMCEAYDDPYHPYHGIDNYTKKGDITFGNLETTVSTRGEPQAKLYHFRVKPEALEYIKEAGFDVLCLANNHISDYGPLALNDTMDNIKEYGMEFTGMWYLDEPASMARIPRPVVLEVDGIKFAYLSFAEIPFSYFRATSQQAGLVPTWSNVMKADIEYAKTVADVVVVSVHWCYVPEYEKDTSQAEMDTCKKLSEWGADIIANHGPHVLHKVEYHNGSLIMHSLGNTVFDQSIKSTHKSAIAMVHLKGKELDRLELVPLRKNDKHQYIPQGNVLEEDVQEGLHLDWDDFNSRMFDSDEFLTEYEGAEPFWYEPFLSAPAIAIEITILVILILVALFLIRRRRKKKKGNKS
jgi:poly-gamma-glutamate synthesis protein (capsule biosynthesis protein)